MAASTPSRIGARTRLAIAGGRLAGMASRLLGRGGGTAVTGVAGQWIDPGLVQHLTSTLTLGSIVVTGTNGKTTTARMVAAIAREAGVEPLANPSGSNLMRGVAAALIGATAPFSSGQNGISRLGVFEVDEATIPEAVGAISPRVIVFTNLFRDQLDRYGEVDTVATLWRSTVATLPAHTTIVLNADDPAVASLARNASCRIITYGIEDARAATETMDHASDYRFCIVCGTELLYSAAFFGHVGHWRCASCGNTRPAPDISASQIAMDEGGSTFTLSRQAEEVRISLPLGGLYNVGNAIAAAASAIAAGLPDAAVERALTSFRGVFGRQERFEIEGRSIVVLLGKNPTGMNQNLKLIAALSGRPHLLFFLNDGIQDGRDISWIWDTDYELIAAGAAAITLGGSRAEELALRLKYADPATEVRVLPATSAALEAALDGTPAGETLYVVPTYTAMIEVRELLAKRGGRPHYWEE